MDRSTYNDYGTEQTFAYMNQPVMYPTDPLRGGIPAFQDGTDDALRSLVAYIINANPTEVVSLLKAKGIALKSLDSQTIQQAVLEMLKKGGEPTLIELIKLHPDTTLILDLHGKHEKGCSCANCKTPFFTWERIAFLGLIVALFVAMYFLTNADE